MTFSGLFFKDRRKINPLKKNNGYVIEKEGWSPIRSVE
jgi:hypothetical protein